MTLIDLLLVWNTGRTARNTRQIAEMATWTEDMKHQYWVEENQRRADQKQTQAARDRHNAGLGRFLGFIFLALVILQLLLTLVFGIAHADEKRRMPPGLTMMTEWCRQEIRRQPQSPDAKMCRDLFADAYGTTTPDRE